MIPPFLFPVRTWSGECAAVFFEYRDAAAFINAELPVRNLYMSEPRYDRRERGYRYEPVQAIVERELPIVDVEHGVAPDTGAPRIAA